MSDSLLIISRYISSHWPMILFYAVFSVAMPIFAAWLTIRFGPNRKEVSRLSAVIAKMAEEQDKQRRVSQFRCEVSFDDLRTDGSRATFTSITPFKLLKLEMRNTNGTPLGKVSWQDDGAKTSHSVVIPITAITPVWNSRPGGNPDAVLGYMAQVDDAVLSFTRPVFLSAEMFQKPGDSTYYNYIRVS
jgi:hypothetical protein